MKVDVGDQSCADWIITAPKLWRNTEWKCLLRLFARSSQRLMWLNEVDCRGGGGGRGFCFCWVPVVLPFSCLFSGRGGDFLQAWMKFLLFPWTLYHSYFHYDCVYTGCNNPTTDLILNKTIFRLRCSMSCLENISFIHTFTCYTA